MTIKEIIADIINKKGAYINLPPSNKIGPTKYGIGVADYSEYFKRPAAAGSIIPKNTLLSEINNITPELAEKIYWTLYYIRPKIDALPEIIRPIMFDMSVSHGRCEAVKILQESLAKAGYSHAIPDGIIGEKTVIASNTAVVHLGKNFIVYLIEARIAAYKSIIAKDPTQAVFEDGWLARAESFLPETV